MGGGRLEYPDDTLSPAASILDSKLLFNSTISDARRDARFMSCDLKYFFLENPMPREYYMSIHSKYSQPDVRDQYHIEVLVAADGYVYIKTINGMYGLKQAAIITYSQLISHTEPHGYYTVPFKNGLWAHKTRKTKFCLGVDDFGVIFFQRRCKSSFRFPKNKLCNFNRLGGTQSPPIENIL